MEQPRIKRGDMKRSGIYVLLCGLLLFSGILSFVYGKRKSNIPSYSGTSVFSNEGNDFEWDDQYIFNLIQSKSSEKIAQIIYSVVPDAHIIAVLQNIFSTQTESLEVKDMLELLFALAGHYHQNLPMQNKIFDLILHNPFLLQGAPFLYIAIESEQARLGMPSVIPNFIRWSSAYKSEEDTPVVNAVKKLVTLTMDYAIEQDNVRVVRKMIEHGISIDSDYAQKILWRVVSGGKQGEFVSILKKYGADVNDSNGNYTLIMQAVLQDDGSLVRALAEAGADVNAVVDDATGTALQIAREKAYIRTEQVLRAYGAKN